MALWKATVYETVTSLMLYTIEADTKEEAEELAGAGDTLTETGPFEENVIRRFIDKIEPAER